MIRRKTRHDAETRFRRWFVVLPSGCWQWVGYVNSWGYGGFNFENRMQYAHRFSYETVHGALARGTIVHHSCENKLCVNPEHLGAVNLDEHNVIHRKRWAINKAKTHCLRGHPFTGANTAVRQGTRQCRKCGAIRMTAWRRANPERAREIKRRAYVRSREHG